MQTGAHLTQENGSIRADFALYTALCAAFLLVFIQLFWNTWPQDLSALYFAGKVVALGMPEAIYAAPPNFFESGHAQEWAPIIAQLGHADEVVLPYLYPPIWAYLLAPVTEILSPIAFFNTVLVVQVSMLAAMPWLGWQIVRPANLPFRYWVVISFALLAFSFPSLGAMIQNQPQITITFLVLAAILCAQRQNPLAAGLLIGLAAAIKLQPALFGLIFLINKDWRAAIATTVSGLLMLAVSVAIAGLDPHLKMLGQLGKINAMSVYSKVNFALESVFYQAHQLIIGAPLPDGRVNGYPILNPPLWSELVPKLILLAGLALLILRRNQMTISRRWLAMALLVALFGPLSWMHYFILPMMLLPALFETVPPRAAWRWLIAFAVLFSYPLFSFLSEFNTYGLISILPTLAMLLALTAHLLLARSSSQEPSP